jgi:hypothetical protein
LENERHEHDELVQMGAAGLAAFPAVLVFLGQALAQTPSPAEHLAIFINLKDGHTVTTPFQSAVWPHWYGYCPAGVEKPTRTSSSRR